MAQAKIDSPTADSIAANPMITKIKGSISNLSGWIFKKETKFKLAALMIISIPNKKGRKLLEETHWIMPIKKSISPERRRKTGIENMD